MTLMHVNNIHIRYSKGISACNTIYNDTAVWKECYMFDVDVKNKSGCVVCSGDSGKFAVILQLLGQHKHQKL